MTLKYNHLYCDQPRLDLKNLVHTSTSLPKIIKIISEWLSHEKKKWSSLIGHEESFKNMTTQNQKYFKTTGERCTRTESSYVKNRNLTELITQSTTI